MRYAMLFVLMAAPFLWAGEVPVDSPLAKEIHTISDYCQPALAAKMLDRSLDTSLWTGGGQRVAVSCYRAHVCPGQRLGSGARLYPRFQHRRKLEERVGSGRYGVFSRRLGGHGFLKLHPDFSPPPSLDRPESKIKDRTEIQLYASAQQLTTLDFYGSGPAHEKQGLGPLLGTGHYRGAGHGGSLNLVVEHWR